MRRYISINCPRLDVPPYRDRDTGMMNDPPVSAPRCTVNATFNYAIQVAG